MKKCLRQKCQKDFEPNKPKQVFCSAKCRVYYSREEKVKPEIIGERKVFIPKNQPVLDKYSKILVGEKVIKKESTDINNLKKQFPIDEPPRLKGENSIEYRLRMIELNESKLNKS